MITVENLQIAVDEAMQSDGSQAVARAFDLLTGGFLDAVSEGNCEDPKECAGLLITLRFFMQRLRGQELAAKKRARAKRARRNADVVSRE